MSQGFEEKIFIEEVTPGYQAVLQYDDGTTIESWGPTEDQAKDNLLTALQS